MDFRFLFCMVWVEQEVGFLGDGQEWEPQYLLNSDPCTLGVEGVGFSYF